MDSSEQHSEACGESEDTNSVCEEERVRKLFQACDGDGDGYIDSQDLLQVCRELNLEDSVEELMRELGADENGRISYQEFLRRRLALKPEIEALRSNSTTITRNRSTPDYLPTSSDNSFGAGSAGKHESWEFDSGARDLSPEPHSLHKLVEAAGSSSSGSLLELANKLHLAAVASLRSEILDLSSRLHAAVQERDMLETALTKTELEKLRVEGDADVQAQRHEERITELHCVIAELTRKLDRQRCAVIAEHEEEQEQEASEFDGVLDCSETHALEDDVVSNNSSDGRSASRHRGGGSGEELAQLRAENAALEEQIARQGAELARAEAVRNERDRLMRKLIEVESRGEGSCGSAPVPALALASTCSPSHVAALPGVPRDSDIPVLKVAERVRLKRMDQPITGSEIASVGVSTTQMAEHLVSGLAEESDLQELGRHDFLARQQLEVEIERLHSRLEHTRAHNNVLALSLEECKNQSDKLHLLVGKYESNAIALRLALGYADRATAAYDCLVALLESELGLILDGALAGKQTTEDRRAAERAARSMLEAEQFGRPTNEGDWNPSDEKRLRELISHLKMDRSRVRDTVIELESVHAESHSRMPMSLAEARKLDLETAVLMQELMAMREDKAELRARLYLMEKERATLELRLSSQDTQKQAHAAAIHHLQTQLQEIEAQNGRESSLASENEEESGETKLNAALRRENRLKDRMHELAETLDKVSRNSELRHMQSAELVNDLKRANSALVLTLEKTKKKYQSRLKKLEQQMLSMVEQHSCQVRALKHRIISLEQESKSNISQLASVTQQHSASETTL